MVSSWNRWACAGFSASSGTAQASSAAAVVFKATLI